MEHTYPSNLGNIKTWKGIMSHKVPTRWSHTNEGFFTSTSTPRQRTAPENEMRVAIDHQDIQQEIRILRMAILNDWTDCQANKQNRNDTAHGGNITADIDAIEFMIKWNIDQTSAWKTSFAGCYQIQCSWTALSARSGFLLVAAACYQRSCECDGIVRERTADKKTDFLFSWDIKSWRECTMDLVPSREHSVVFSNRLPKYHYQWCTGPLSS